jgi:hypothetical protein
MENTGRFTHSIIPSVTLKSWFADWKMERKVVTTVSRIMSGHCGVRAHLKRFEIVEDVCLFGRPSINHQSTRFSSQRIVVHRRFVSIEVVVETPLRDFCAQSNWVVVKECHAFLMECDMKLPFAMIVFLFVVHCSDLHHTVQKIN